MFLWWPSTKIVSSHHDSSKNMAPSGRGLFSLYIYIENLKKSSCRKPLDRFQYNLAEMSLWCLFFLYIYIENFKNLLVLNSWADFLQKCFFDDPLPRLFKPSWFIKKHGHQGAGLIFPIYLYRKLKKSSCQKPLDRFQYNVTEMFLWCLFFLYIKYSKL